MPGKTDTEEGAVLAGAGRAPFHFRGLVRQRVWADRAQDLEVSFIPNITHSQPTITCACSNSVFALVLTELHALQSLFAAEKHNTETLGCKLQSVLDIADPSLGPSSPHISIQHGAWVEGGEGVAVRGLLWRVQLE